MVVKKNNNSILTTTDDFHSRMSSSGAKTPDNTLIHSNSIKNLKRN